MSEASTATDGLKLYQLHDCGPGRDDVYLVFGRTAVDAAERLLARIGGEPPDVDKRFSCELVMPAEAGSHVALRERFWPYFTHASACPSRVL